MVAFRFYANPLAHFRVSFHFLLIPILHTNPKGIQLAILSHGQSIADVLYGIRFEQIQRTDSSRSSVRRALAMAEAALLSALEVHLYFFRP